MGHGPLVSEVADRVQGVGTPAPQPALAFLRLRKEPLPGVAAVGTAEEQAPTSHTRCPARLCSPARLRCGKVLPGIVHGCSGLMNYVGRWAHPSAPCRGQIKAPEAGPQSLGAAWPGAPARLEEPLGALLPALPKGSSVSGTDLTHVLKGGGGE